MQYGVSSLVWVAPFIDKDIPLIGHARSMGFDILEIPVWDEPFDIPKVAEELRKHEVEASVAAYQTEDRDMTHPDRSVRDRGIQHLKHCVDAASEMGATRIVGPLGAPAHAAYKLRTPAELKRDIDTCAAGLREAAAYAEDKGVLLVYEPLNRYETAFCSRVRDVAALVDAVDSPSFRMLIDVFHANIEEVSLTDAVETAGHRLAYVHAIDSHRGTPGTGHLNWSELKSALEGIGYDGPLVMEAMPYDVEWLAVAGRIWHRPAPNPDALATEGLKFLKDLFEPSGKS